MPGDLPATITDAGMNVIYAATGSAGNGVGNFNFMIQEGANVSPAGTVTVNVSPPGVPSVLYLAKNTSSVEIQFDRIMANPMSKKDQFTVKSNGTTAIIDSATLKPGDSSTILLYLSAPLTSPVLISYSPGDIVSASGGFLLPFSDQQVLLNSQTIHFTQSLSKKYSDSPFTLNASVTSGLGLTYSSSNLSVTTIAVNIATFHTTGTSDITARQAGNATYAPAKFTKSITIAKGDQAITFGAMSIKTFGDADFIPGASASSGLPVAYSSGNTAVATIENGQIHIIGAGTAIITASQSGSALWNPATEKTQTLTVLKATATVSLGSLSATYNGLPHTVSVTSIPSDLPVTITYDASGTAPANAGSYSVNAVVNHLNYQGTASGTLTIDKAPLTATADDKSKVYGQNNPALTISYSGLMNSESSAVIDVKPVAATAADVTTAAGDIAITVSGGTDNNYSFIYASGNLTINKATLIVTADDKTRIYGDANPPLTISYSGFVNSDNASVLDALPTVSTTAIASTNAGSVAITVLGGNDNNYLFTLVSGTLTITKATASVTLGNLTTLYTGFPQEASITTSPAGLVSDFTYNSSPSLPINSGSYALTVTINDVNYQGTASDIFIINKAVLIATADNKTRIYGENNPPLTISYSGFVNNENVSVLDFPLPVAATSADVSTDVGEVDITVSGGSDNNYLFSYISGTLTISKAMLTAFADDKTRKYGDANPSLSVSFSGFANSDNEPSIDITPVAATSAIASTNAGTVPITVSGGSDNNYTFTYVSGTLTITKAAASIIPGNLTATYTGLPHAISTITTPPGLYVDCTYNGTPAMPVNTGSYSFIATINDINYQGTATGTITINKAPLTFTADNKSKGYMTPVPSLTYTISGFVNSEIIQVLDLLPSIQTTAALNSPMGTYPITISGGSDNNYTYLYVPGTLEITKTPQTIVFDHSPEKLLIGENYTLEAISTSGLPVLFESLDNNIASVSGTIITGISKGTVQIRAFNAGDQNYNAAEIFATVEVYSTHKDIMHLFTPNSDGINDLWELPELSAWGKCDVRVYNRWGKLIYANRNYNNQWDATSNGNPVPEGAYYFIIKTERAGVVKGTVNIVR
jgi:gliding motility-associated-like protein